jgi:hypothetical protein
MGGFARRNGLIAGTPFILDDSLRWHAFPVLGVLGVLGMY